MPRLLLECPACGKSAFEPHAVSLRQGFPHYLRVSCLSCGLLFANPQVTDEEAAHYYHHYYDKGLMTRWKADVRTWRDELSRGIIATERVELHRTAQRIFTAFEAGRPRAASPLRWLEIGAGLGEFSYLAARRGYTVTATEMDPDAVAFMGTELGLGNALHGSVTNPSLRDASFDAVVLHHVLEHVTDLKGTLRRARDVLVPGGALFIGVPNLGSSGYRLYRAGSFARFRLPRVVDGVEHTFGFTKPTLRRCVTDAGFTVESLTAWGSGSTAPYLASVLRAEGVRRLAIKLAEAIFRTKLELVARAASSAGSLGPAAPQNRP